MMMNGMLKVCKNGETKRAVDNLWLGPGVKVTGCCLRRSALRPLHCIELHWTALNCIELHCTALDSAMHYISALYFIALHCIELQCTALTIVYCTGIKVTKCKVQSNSFCYSLQFTAPHCNQPHCNPPDCNALHCLLHLSLEWSLAVDLGPKWPRCPKWPGYGCDDESLLDQWLCLS